MFLCQGFPFLAGVQRIGNGFRVALRLPGMTGREVIPGPTKVIPDLIRNPDLAEGLRMAVSETVSGQVTGRYDVFVSGFSVFGWSATHWKWIPGRAALALNDRKGSHFGPNKSHSGPDPESRPR